MAWSLLLAFFFLWCPGANSQYTLTQPAAQSFPLRQSAKISCTMSRDSQVGSYYISWYQQKAGESPKYLLYNTGTNGRFTGSKDTSANAAYLTITNLQAEDEADYYCGGDYGSGGNYWYPQCYTHMQKENQWDFYLDHSKAEVKVNVAERDCEDQRANSQITLTQPEAQSFPPGQPAKISCTMSRDSQVGSYYISWYQQKAGESPKYLFCCSNSNGRFKGSKDTSANVAYLTITNLQAEDEADYYCGGYYNDGRNYWYPR
ncbi:immunoglobulin iota chain-like [Thamnophis elegans]|uniref:immunoglobulin iota chain-like n=1 Tax=Thamnophis elegans TaxID=35005 RepID=UPI001377A63B|nr:immunoglobulin iota chain-like [Thamnophis elegans]